MNKCKLGELLEIKHGYAFKSENYVEKSQYALVTLANISGTNNFQFTKEKTTYYGAKFPEEFILKTGDLIMPLTEQVVGLFGNSAFVPEMENITFVLNQRVGKVIPKKGKADIYYLHYLLSTNSVREQLEYRASGTRQRNISPKDIYDVDVFVPDYEEQKKIGSTLYKLEQRVNNNNKINAELEAMAKTLYDYWFLQFEFPNEEGKPYKSSGGKMVWNEELKREIPEGWEVLKVSDITNVVTGKEDANFAVENGAYKFFTCSQDILLCDEYSFEGSAVLIAGNGDFNVKHYTGKFNAYQRTYVLIPKEKEFYGCLYIAAKEKIDYFKAGANGSIVKFITKGDVEQITMLKPRNDNLFDTINKLIEQIEIIQKENEELTSLRDFLLPLLMNGQVGFKE